MRKSDNHRLLSIHLKLQHGREEGGALVLSPVRAEHFSIE